MRWNCRHLSACVGWGGVGKLPMCPSRIPQKPRSSLLANIFLFLPSMPVRLLVLKWGHLAGELGGLLKSQEDSPISGTEMVMEGGDLGRDMLCSGAKTRPRLRWGIETGVLGGSELYELGTWT